MSKVLIVDDFKTQQAFLKNLLAEINIDFETASSGIEALEILNRQDISLVLKALGNSMFNSSYRVLLLDDVSIQTEVWAKVLEMPSFIYDKANTAQDALNFLRTHTYDAILTDYLMPNVDGERFVKKIKSITEFQHIPIFMITSHKEMQKTGLTGVEKVFLKPFNSAEVKTALKLAVGWNN